MILGVGTDLLAKERLGGLNLDAPFFRKTFSEKEREQAAAHPIPRDHYCNLFASKEAVFKALRANPEIGRLSDIEILNDSHGAPHVTLHGQLASLAALQGVTSIELSLSGEKDFALAFAVAVASHSVPGQLD